MAEIAEGHIQRIKISSNTGVAVSRDPGKIVQDINNNSLQNVLETLQLRLLFQNFQEERIT